MINSSVGGYNGGRANLLDALFSIKMGFNSLYGNNILPILCIVLCVFLSLKKYGLKISLLIGVFLLIRHVPEPVHASNTTLEYGI